MAASVNPLIVCVSFLGTAASFLLVARLLFVILSLFVCAFLVAQHPSGASRNTCRPVSGSFFYFFNLLLQRTQP